MSDYIDLHSHTYVSDGSLSPEQLVAEAKEKKLSALAITDHDQIDALAPARKAAGDDLEIISGVEISSSIDGNTLHILGYFVDETHPGLLQYLENLRKGRNKRMGEMIEQLRKVGVELSLEEVRSVAKGATLGRPHLAKALIKGGFVKTQQEAFDRYLARGQAGFVPYENAKPAPAIEVIREAGGLSFLAHPGLVRQQKFVDHVIELGINGLEVLHPEHKPAQIEHYQDLAKRNNLLMSGGSDYHGPDAKRKGDLGCMQVPFDYLEIMRRSL